MKIKKLKTKALSYRYYAINFYVPETNIYPLEIAVDFLKSL
jgi:hypothetical protein